MRVTFKPGLRVLSVPGAPERPKKLPSVFRQAKNLAGAIGRTGKVLAQGKNPTVSKEEADTRQAICKTCDLFRSEDERCTHPKCGCFTKVKVWLKAERCPATPPKW